MELRSPAGFFDNDSFPFLREGPFCLYTSEADFSEAVIYDRRWFIHTLQRLKLRVRSTTPPSVPGHQWTVFIEKRAPATTDRFPLGEEGAEWLCGATLKPMAARTNPPAVMPRGQDQPSDSQGAARDEPRPPSFVGALAELAAMRRSWVWRIWRALTVPGRVFKRIRKLMITS
jgi:hypothetical protein